MNFLHGLFLSFVQSATEFLPVSSSGHLLFLKGLLQFQDMPLIYDILMHVGSLVAVCIFYASKIRETLSGACVEIRQHLPERPQLRFIIYVGISSIVTFACYILFKDAIESKFETPSVLSVTFLITSAVLLSTRWLGKRESRNVRDMAWWFAVVIGLFQAMAILPGVSRSGTTISLMLLFSIRRDEAAYYSFMLFIPAALGALVFKLSDMSNVAYLLNNWSALLLSFIAASLFSYLFLTLLTWIVRRGRIWIFAFYTFALAGISWAVF